MEYLIIDLPMETKNATAMLNAHALLGWNVVGTLLSNQAILGRPETSFRQTKYQEPRPIIKQPPEVIQLLGAELGQCESSEHIDLLSVYWKVRLSPMGHKFTRGGCGAVVLQMTIDYRGGVVTVTDDLKGQSQIIPDWSVLFR